MHLLFMRGDDEVGNFIIRGLREEGHVVDRAKDATEGYFLATDRNYTCILIDRVVGDVCGISLLSFMRSNGFNGPVIMLGRNGDLGRRDEMDMAVTALEAGADDYIRKPVAIAELVARLHAVARRGPTLSGDSTLSVGALSMNLLTREVWRDGVSIRLQPRCYNLLEVLMENAGSIVTRTRLLESVWEYHFEPNSSVVETYISRLRRKVDKPFETQLIRTIRGGGYMISEPTATQVDHSKRHRHITSASSPSRGALLS